jgi:hypothetical protein
MLSPLQEKVLTLFFSLPEASGFALAGGGALVVRSIVQRTTRDLDLFTTIDKEVRFAADALRAQLPTAGLQGRIIRSGTSFTRLVVSAGLDEELVVDLAVDHRLAPAEMGPVGPILALDDLAADKLLALFGRAEARDFVDVWALAQVMATERLLELARTKDPGFDVYVLATMIGTLDRHPRSELEIDDASVVSLRQFFAGLRASLIHGTLGEVGR